MPKKTEEIVEETSAPEITPIAHDFLREDLNELRDKVNQIIETVNNL